MAYRTGSATDVADLLNQLDDFLTTRNEYQNVLVTGTGDGVLTEGVTANSAPTEDWVLTCTVGGPAGTFTVAGSLSGAQANATSGTPYDNGIVAFTITDGATAWIATDAITFDLVSNMGVTEPYKKKMHQNTCRRIIQSNDGTEFVPYDIQAHSIVEGKFPEEKGLRVQGASMRSNNPSITDGQYITSAAWGAGLSSYSVSVWVQNVNKFSHSGATTSPDAYSSVQGRLCVGPEVDGETYGKSGIYIANTHSNIDFGKARTVSTFRHLVYQAALTGSEWLSSSWHLLTMTITPTAYKVYIDGAFVGEETVNHLNYTRSHISALFSSFYARSNVITVQGADFHKTAPIASYGFQGVIADFCMWNKELSAGEITTLYGSSAAVSTGNIDLLWKLQFVEETPKNIIYQNDSTRGYNTVVGIGYNEEVGYTTSGDKPSIFFENYPLPYTPQLGTEDNFDSTTRGYDSGTTYGDRYISRDSMRMYGAVRNYNEAIEKFWFTANEDRIMIAYKIHDTGATTQKDPVYQVMYSGLLLQSGHNTNNSVVFGSSASVADWQSSSTSFTVGAQNSISGRCWGAGTTWHRYKADIGGPNEATIRAIGGAHYIWPIQIYDDDIDGPFSHDELGFASSITYQDLFGVEFFGAFDGLYKVSPLNVIAEDIITVASEDYVVLSNVWATSENDWFAFKLK